MDRPDQHLWDLFDKAQTGELQSAEARKLGMQVNPYYLSDKIADTREIATAMELLPWLQNVHQNLGSGKIMADTFQEQYEEGVDAERIIFLKGVWVLKRTGLVSITEVSDSTGGQLPNKTYSISRRAITANYREVLPPYQPSCSGCLGRVALAGGVGIGVTVAESAAFNEIITGDVYRWAQGMIFVGATMMGIGLAEKSIATIQAAKVYRSYHSSEE